MQPRPPTPTPEPFTEGWYQEYGRQMVEGILQQVKEAMPPGAQRALELGGQAAGAVAETAQELGETAARTAQWMGKLFTDPAGWVRDLQQGGEEAWQTMQASIRALGEEVSRPVIVVGQALRGFHDWASAVIGRIRADPTLILGVRREDFETVRRIEALAWEMGQRLMQVDEAFYQLALAACGPSQLVLPALDEKRARWQARAHGQATVLQGAAVKISQFMAFVLQRDGQAVEPLSTRFIPLRLRWMSPRSPELEIHVETLPQAVAGLEKALDGFKEVRDQILLAFQQLSGWEGYARLGYQAVAEDFMKDLEESVGTLIRVVEQARALPGLARELQRGLAALAAQGLPDPLRIAPDHFEPASLALRASAAAMEEAAGSFRRGAGELRAAWAMQPGHEAALVLEGYGAEADRGREEIARMIQLLVQSQQHLSRYLTGLMALASAFS